MNTIKEETCAVVILYNPTKKEIENIYYLSHFVNRLFIYDNSEVSCSHDFSALQNTLLLKKNGNMGIGFALNSAILFAKNEGFQKIFLFDQDSKIDENFISEMLDFSKNNEAALWVPNYYDKNAKKFGIFVLFNYWFRKRVFCQDKNKLFVDFAITSGSLLNIDVWEKISYFNEEYFIDHVDTEYCLRLREHDYRIAVNCQTVLDHKIGEATRHTILGKEFTTSNHSAIRRYYISRNYIALIKQFKLPSLLFSYLVYLTKTVMFISLYENNTKQKIFQTFKGCIDGIRNKMGKKD